MAKLALIIGISEYDKPGLNPLPAAVKDVAAMERILKAPDMGGFDEVTSIDISENSQSLCVVKL